MNVVHSSRTLPTIQRHRPVQPRAHSLLMLPFHKLTLVSVNPGTVGRRQIAAKSPDALPTAAGGILPGKASADDGAIRPDDLLVSSSKLGYAMNGTDRGLTLRATSDRATS